MDYTSYLPDINVEEGKARVMNNLKLYLRLVGKFDGAKMAADVIKAMDAGDNTAVIHATHALRGTAANLGFPVVLKVSGEIEMLAKEEKEYSHLKGSLNEAVAALQSSVDRLLQSQ